MVFHWSLSDSKSSQVSRTRLRILALLSYAVVWIVSTRPPTSKSSRHFNNPLDIVPNAPITIGTIVTFMFHNFFQSSSKVEVLIPLFTFLQIYSVVRRDSKVYNFADYVLFLLIIVRSSLLVGIRWSVCMLKSHSFSCQRYLMIFHWSLRDSKSPQVSRTLLSILDVLNNAVVWMVSTRPSPPVSLIIH